MRASTPWPMPSGPSPMPASAALSTRREARLPRRRRRQNWFLGHRHHHRRPAAISRGPDSPGQASYRDRADFEAAVDKLAALPADYRILSIHYELEGRAIPDERQPADWRSFAAEEKGIDLIVGRHPHVAQGVELDGKSLIFYGLGNFLHPGTAEMTRFGMCRDYGLMAKVHLARIDGAWTRRGDRGDPARQYPSPARAIRGEECRKSYLCAQSSVRRPDDDSRREGRALYPAVRRLGALLRRRRRASAARSARSARIGCRRLSSRTSRLPRNSPTRARTSHSTAGPPPPSVALRPAPKARGTPRRSRW